jgi:ketosteroid isomerase-like protein
MQRMVPSSLENTTHPVYGYANRFLCHSQLADVGGPTSQEVHMSQNAYPIVRTDRPGHHWSLYILFAFLGALVTFAGARAEQKATDDATFRKLIDGYCAAWSSLNVDNAAKFYAKDTGLVFYDVTPFSYLGWKDYDAGVRKNLMDSVAATSLTPGNDLKVTRHGNVAWTTVSMHFTAKMKDGKTIDTAVRYTGIWEKHGKNWLLVHEHLSVPMGG